MFSKKYIFNEIDVKTIVKMYVDDKLSLKNVGKHFLVDSKVIKRILKEKSIDIRDVKENGKLYHFDESFFDSIDNEEKAYWLGFIYADGFVTSGKILTIKLAIKDIEHLRKFVKCIDGNIPIHTYVTKEDDKSFSGSSYEYCMVTVTNKHMYKSLVGHGVVERKTKVLKFPEIRKDLERHFIRGFFDGDGSVYKSNSSNAVSLLGTFDMINGTKESLSISNNPKIYKEKRCDDIYYIVYFGIYAEEFFKKVYENSTIYLDRKFDKFTTLKM